MRFILKNSFWFVYKLFASVKFQIVNPEFALKYKMLKILWDFLIKIDYLTMVRKTDLVIMKIKMKIKIKETNKRTKKNRTYSLSEN